jgi:penicillin-binding protein 2
MGRREVATVTFPRSQSGVAADPRLERRLPMGAFLVILVWTVLLARLFFLQVVEGDRYRISAERNSIRTHRVPVPRGIVTDRHGVILADSRPAFDVFVVPHETDDLGGTLRRIAALTGEPEELLAERLGEPKGRARFQPQLLLRDLPRDELTRVEARLWALPGVMTQASPLRAYPFGDSTAHVLGTLGEINRDQLESRRHLGYHLGDQIGQSGIEALLELDLRGRPGGRSVLVNVHGRELELLGELPPQPARNVVLTLDQRLQGAAEAALDASGHSGAAVAIDPRSGKVLALASRPSVDPNRFAAGIDHETWEGFVNDLKKPLQNRAVQGQYPPASTYKVVTAIAGLEEGVIEPTTTVQCNGSYRLGRRRYRCWRRGGHGEVDLHRAIVESCDVYFYSAGHQLGVDRLAYYARALGAGTPTGIELGPEPAGLVPTRAWKERRMGEAWIEGETLSVAIGQGFNLWTPLQLASVYATIANGGTRYRPYVVSRVEEANGLRIRTVRPESLGVVPISAQTLEFMRNALRGVVHEEHGTAYILRRLPDGVEVGAKTGTAQVVAFTSELEEMEDDEIPEEFRDHGWMVAFAPVDAPRIVVVALVEHGGFGSTAAGPVVRAVLEAFFSPKDPRLARH